MKRFLSIYLLSMVVSISAFAYEPIVPTLEENQVFENQVLF